MGSLKIKPCPRCWRAYSLPAFRRLPLLSTDDDGAETRTCSACGQEVVVDVRALETLDLRTPAERAADEILSAERAHRRLPWPVLLAFVLGAAICALAFALWSR